MEAKIEALDPSTPYVTNAEVSRILFHIASLLEMTQDNQYRVRAYRRAALGVLFLARPLAEYVVHDMKPPLPGVGDRIHSRLKDLVNSGQMGVYSALLEEVGEPVSSLLDMYGVGPKTEFRLVNELGITSIEDLDRAAREGRIQKLHGFGPKRQSSLGAQASALLERAAA